MVRILVVLVLALTLAVSPAQAGWKTKALVAVGGYATTKPTPMAVKACMKSIRCRAWAARVGTDRVPGRKVEP